MIRVLLLIRKLKPQFKSLNQGLQSVLGWRITRCGNSGLQSVLGVGLESVTKSITKCIRDCKVWQDGLQSASGITKCGGIKKWISTACIMQWYLSSSLG